MGDPDDDAVARLLGQLQTGDTSAQSRLLPLVYRELRAIADNLFQSQRRGHTLQPTALVHEAFIRLVGNPSIAWQGRSHFLAVAAKAMRNVLADHARKRKAMKRGGALNRITLSIDAIADAKQDIEVLDLDEALCRLGQLNERQVQVVELRFFGGLQVAEVAHVLGVSPRTVKAEWHMARAWLRRELDKENGS